MVHATHPCGTAAAARRHRYHGEPPCADCAEAERADHRVRYGTENAEATRKRRDYYRDIEGPRRKAKRQLRTLKRDLPCSEDCGRLVGSGGSKGRCQRCNQRLARAELRKNPQPCVVDGCERPVRSLGQPYCNMHRSRMRRYGEPGPAESLIGPRGEWRINKKGYRIQVINGREVLEHRVVMERKLGRPLHRWENVHHKNGNRADNALSNLELWVKPQPPGQRAEDLAAWVTEFYPELVTAALMSLAA